ncbi:hypothetical protein GYMLUDRAFT_668951 [Collybiopsis luxurians FD-317 M1]|uniref:Uncharacterized protein n=1 Tax=Collybiopsis luxurians FD-317 M1 TaxID=944289 RepID=A0A0D0CUK0_9AGAR|nr:hypothetical protein GYMLUDRAFT_668951 [Collybiopsis luxurians FD-317 M1]
MARKQNKGQKKKKASEKAKRAAADHDEDYQERLRAAMEFELFMEMLKEASRQRGDHERSFFPDRHSEHPPNDNTKAWDRYIQEEVQIWTGMDQFGLLLCQCFCVLVILAILLVFLILDKIGHAVFAFQSHPNMIFSAIYVLFCLNTGLAIPLNESYKRVNRSHATNGLPFLQAAHMIYYHSDPYARPPSYYRNPYYRRPYNGTFWILIAKCRVWVLKFVSKSSSILLYFPFLVFRSLARRYDAFPSQWWTIALALGTFWVALKIGQTGSVAHDGRPHDEKKERDQFFEFWGGIGLQMSPP